MQTLFFGRRLQCLTDRAGRSNNGPRAKRQQRPEHQRFDRKFQVIFAREKISSELENKSSSRYSSSFFFRNISFDCDYTHV
jgi:hypothetical protein